MNCFRIFLKSEILQRVKDKYIILSTNLYRFIKLSKLSINNKYTECYYSLCSYSTLVHFILFRSSFFHECSENKDCMREWSVSFHKGK